MKRFVSLSLSIFTVMCLLLATEHRALAYVDPGSGLMALQTGGAALAAAGYFLRRRVMALFGKKTAEPVKAKVVSVDVKNGSRKAA